MKTRKKGILFYAVVAGIMLSSGVTIAVNPGQWFGDSSLEGDVNIPTVEEFEAFDPDALGLDLDYNPGENYNFVLQMINHYQTNMSKNTKYLLNAHNH